MTQKENSRWKLTLQIDEEINKMIKNLREEHCVNISALCRDSIEEWYKKLNPEK